MANSITLFQKYIDALDKVYKWAGITSVLDGDSSLTKAGANTNEIVIPKMSMDGLKDYSRNSGYLGGSVTLTNETVQFNYDRGIKFTVDAMDNEETAGVAFGQLAGEFIRTKVAPELDAFRFATYAGTSGISGDEGELEDGDAVLDALLAARNQMDEDEVPETERMLFITPTHYNSVLALETYKSRETLNSFSFIKKVPPTRFYTAIDLLDGTSVGETQGGYQKHDGAMDINFMIIHKPALMQYTKHLVKKIITPELNQTDDGWMFFFRSYGLADVYENKVAGIYLHAWGANDSPGNV